MNYLMDYFLSVMYNISHLCDLWSILYSSGGLTCKQVKNKLLDIGLKTCMSAFRSILGGRLKTIFSIILRKDV